MICTTLDEYLQKYGGLLGEQAQERLDPLHVPGRDPLPDFSRFKRQPFPAQQHVIAATVKALRRQKSVAMIAEMGTGKTLKAMITAHLHAQQCWNPLGTFAHDGTVPYRALVFCPGQLVRKWEREILETVPGAHVTLIESCHQLNSISAKLKGERCTWNGRGAWRPSTGPEWYIIARDRAKLGAKWSGQASERIGKHAMQPQRGGLRCPKCGGRIEDKDGNGISIEVMSRRMLTCQRPHPDEKLAARDKKCGEFLWSYYGPQNGGFDRFEPAKYIHRRMRGFFDYLVIDEFHEEKGADTAQANAAGSLIAACKKVICLSGTLIGGYADHVRSIMFRMAPMSLVEEGLGWKDVTAFNRRYGRMERTVFTRSDVSDWGESNRNSRGSGRKVTESVKPGIVPTLFGRHLLGNSLYLSLAEVSDKLPPLKEIIVPVAMDAVMGEEYRRVEEALKEVNKDLVRTGNKALLGAMLQCLLCYPDLPYDWDWVGYWKFVDGEKDFIRVVKPQHLKEQIWTKEQEIIKAVQREKQQGRQCWVFVQYTDTRPVLDRLERLMKEAGLKVGVLRASVSLSKREQWIAENCGGLDVVISHPKLVETGLDLFDKKGGHNFCTLMFYETGYNLFTLRQAARRSWRIGQRRECRVYYFYYDGTAQAAAMALMGKKLAAAQALEGKFTADGLVAMGGDDVSVEMALAQSLDSQMKGDAARAWETIADLVPPADEAPQLDASVTEQMEEEFVDDGETAELLELLGDIDFDVFDEPADDQDGGDLSDLLDGLDDLLANVA